ncbi:aspartic peptidase A1 [Suillus spraguei]|nr:aspartic peptidase A1 [Suillus spraguei]
MFSASSLLTLLALSITGSPVEVLNSRITLPMTRRLKFSNSTNLVQQDEARMAAFRDYSTHGRRAHVPVQNDQVGYVVSVGIGAPPTTYKLVVDTGSANTWVGANTRYVETDTSFNTGRLVGVTYTSAAFFRGVLWTDTFTLANEFTITGMSIGVASDWEGFVDDGVLGIGPTALTMRTLGDSATDTIPTVTDCLCNEGIISKPLVGIFFRPATTDADNDGELTFGEPDPTMYIGSIGYTTVTATPRSARYWGIDQRITYGSMEILRSTAGVVDCGMTFLFLASDAYERYQTATGADLDPVTDLLTVTPDQYGALQDLDFHIGEETYSLTPNGQIWPRSLNSVVDGFEDFIFLIVKNLGRPTGSGLDFINGYVFLQRFYTVFDPSDLRVGFAITQFTDADTN